MNPVVAAILFIASLIGVLVWVLLYFFVVEGLLKKVVGAIFSVTIGASRLVEMRGVGTRSRFRVSSWRVTEPQSAGCVLGTFIWVLGGTLRSLFIGLPVGCLLVIALFFGYLATRP